MKKKYTNILKILIKAQSKPALIVCHVKKKLEKSLHLRQYQSLSTDIYSVTNDPKLSHVIT